jgi:hypothetical protein
MSNLRRGGADSPDQILVRISLGKTPKQFKILTMIVRDLEKVRVILKEATELDIAYAYDDLVFPEHAAFLIQFDDTNENNYFCYFHQDCLSDSKAEIVTNLCQSLKKRRSTLVPKGSFLLEQKGEEIEIKFI